MGFPDSSVGKESACNVGNSGDSCFRKIYWRRDRLLTPVFLGFSCGLAGNESPGRDPWVGKIPWKRERLPTPVFWPGECHGLYSWKESESDTTDWPSLRAQLVKNPPAMQETPVQFLCQEDPLEKGQATHSSILGLPWWLSW